MLCGDSLDIISTFWIIVLQMFTRLKDIKVLKSNLLKLEIKVFTSTVFSGSKALKSVV